MYKKKNRIVIDCLSCGFCHFYPIPLVKKLEKMYTHKFYQEIKPNYIKKDESENLYWNITFDDKLDTIERKIRKENRTILDIGCGPGFFLKRAKERGWITTGIEPSTEAANHAEKQGLNILRTFFENYNFSTHTKFDAIHSKFFLEHITDPLKICKSCFNLLNPGGVICFEVPNDFNTLQKIVVEKLKKPHYWISHPDHINYFSLMSLTKLLKKVGFKIFYAEATFPLELFLLFGLDYVNNDKVGRKIHSMRMNFESVLFSSGNNNLKRNLYNFLVKQGLGREIIVYAQKSYRK